MRGRGAWGRGDRARARAWLKIGGWAAALFIVKMRAEASLRVFVAQWTYRKVVIPNYPLRCGTRSSHFECGSPSLSSPSPRGNGQRASPRSTLGRFIFLDARSGLCGRLRLSPHPSDLLQSLAPFGTACRSSRCTPTMPLLPARARVHARTRAEPSSSCRGPRAEADPSPGNPAVTPGQ